MIWFFKKKKESDYYQIQKDWKIKRSCLDLILECAKSNYPKEFGGLLRVDNKSKSTIIEVIILPGTISGDSHAIFQLHMLPIDFSIIGTVHSHPSYNPSPSEADLHLFRKYGKIHIIVAKPFNESSWKMYDYLGNKIDAEIV
jgi:proteasome lid subunit RPN8/RPN11